MANVTKSGNTRVETAKLVKTCTDLGLEIQNRAGWFLAYKPGNKKARLLVHTGKRGTNCIELVGFESPAAIAHPIPPAKTMTQMLDCNLPEKEILRNFYKTARILAKGVEAAKHGEEEAGPQAGNELPGEEAASEQPAAQ